MKEKHTKQSFYEIIEDLNFFWRKYGCFILPSFDLEMGAGTYSSTTFLKVLGKGSWNIAYPQFSRRPSDGSYLTSLNKRQRFLQYQVLLKPAPNGIQTIYLNSLQFLGINPTVADIKFIEDNWESPILGAYGKGWEVWLNGIEVTQFTYFQQMGDLLCNPISCEITYGLERVTLFLQKNTTISNLIWDNLYKKPIKYNIIFDKYELDMCYYNFDLANIEMLLNFFTYLEIECKKLLHFCIVEAAYEIIIKMTHLFNLLESRAAFSQIEKKNYIVKIRRLSSCVAKIYFIQHNILNKL